jgi:glycosyltransferase involved in cell wall biosynthesis
MKKILFCYGCSMNPIEGGVQKVSDILAKYFLSVGYYVDYLISFQDEIDTYHYPVNIYNLPDRDFFSQPNICYYHQLLKELSVDIIINHDASNDRSDFFLNTGVSTVKKISLYHQDPLYGLNLVSSNLVFNKLYKLFPSIYSFLKKTKQRRQINNLLNKSDRLILLSEHFCKDLSEILGINSDRIQSISNPIILEKSNEVFKKKQILFVSRLEFEQKRPELMLLIWSKLHKIFPDWELIFLGDGNARMDLEDLVNSMELVNVRFEGFVNPIPYYKEASIIGMTSDYEGFGMVLIEAMQFGVVPISLFNWNSLQDIIVNNNTGILIDNNNIDEYSFKLSQLIRDEEERRRLSKKSVEHVQKFDIEVIGLKWLNLLESI